MQLRRALRDCAQMTQEAMGHERPDEGGLPAVTGGRQLEGGTTSPPLGVEGLPGTNGPRKWPSGLQGVLSTLPGEEVR